MTKIHPTSIVSKDAFIDEDVEIGPYCIIEGKVRIGAGSKLFSNVFVGEFTQIGKGNLIYPFVSLGTPPQDIGFKGEETELIIGDNNVFREFITVNRATTKEKRKTIIGNYNFFMAYTHIAHDCKIGNYTVFANCATLAGHVEIQDYATIGGLSAFHQFTKMGCYAFVGGCSAVAQDVPPYALVVGNRAEFEGVNRVGLRRHNFSDETIQAIKSAYHTIYYEGLSLKEALEKIEKSVPAFPQIAAIIEFVKSSKRGIVKAKKI